MHSPLLIIQHITVTWSKASRGGQAAVRRNAVPEALRLPSRHQLNSHTLLQTIQFSEAKNFTHPEEAIRTDITHTTEKVGCVAIDWSASDLAHVAFQYDRKCAGVPEHGWMNDSFDISPGQWTQIVYNGRFTSVLGMVGPENRCWYEKHIVNVGLLETYDERVFIKTPPMHRYALIRRLF